MVTIVLYGDKREKKLRRIFEKNPPEQYCVYMVSEQSVSVRGKGKSLLLLDVGKTKEVCTEPCLLLVKPGTDLSGLMKVEGENVIALASSACPEQIAKLAEMKVPTVVCGMSSKDTVTFSSFSDSAAAVSLQRTVEKIDGEFVEPMEITLEFDHRYDSSTVLFYAAAMILCGVYSQENANGEALRVLE